MLLTAGATASYTPYGQEFGTSELQYHAPSGRRGGEGPAGPKPSAPDFEDGQPESEVGKRLKAIRQQAIADGMKLMSNEEILYELGRGRERGA